MKAHNRERLKQMISEMGKILEAESIPMMEYPRVGDAGTPLSIEKVIDDEENKTVVVVWGDGTTTRSVADPLDDYDFEIGFGLCISKKFVKNLNHYAKTIRESSRCVHVKKRRPKSPRKTTKAKK